VVVGVWDLTESRQPTQIAIEPKKRVVVGKSLAELLTFPFVRDSGIGNALDRVCQRRQRVWTRCSSRPQTAIRGLAAVDGVCRIVDEAQA